MSLWEWSNAPLAAEPNSSSFRTPYLRHSGNLNSVLFHKLDHYRDYTIKLTQSSNRIPRGAATSVAVFLSPRSRRLGRSWR